MIMTPEEQHDMLQLVKKAKKINAKKTDLMEELVQMAQIVAQQNEVLIKENEMLKRQLEIAERQILRSTDPKVTNEIN